MPKLTIDGMEIEVEQGVSILQACEQLGIEVPRFCYHDRLSVPANCRMCLVEVEKSPKPVASCAMACGDNMVVHTKSEKVKKARKGVMEFLLINHPLDCPICDQGGECDLQDQAMAYGFDRSRFQENKRAVSEKYMGPLIKTFMTRCIHCTRCIRFAEEVAGVSEIGAVNRGEDMEISTYISAAIHSELSGNLVDVCPVGALTSKPYSYVARPWELRKINSIDVMDAVGSNIRVDVRGNEVMRILPRLHEDVNEEWIADKTRYACDGLKYQRLDQPYLRKNGKLEPVRWDEAFAAIVSKIKAIEPRQMAALAGDLCDVESMVALKDLFTALGSPHMDCRSDGAVCDPADRSSYIFNTSIAGIEKADAILLVGTNPRWEAPLINARIRKTWLQKPLKIGVIGEDVDLGYPAAYLGAGPESLQSLLDGKLDFAKLLEDAKNPMIVLGSGAVARDDGAAILQLARKLVTKFSMVHEDWNGFNILQRAASRVGGLDCGFVPQDGGYATKQIWQAVQPGSQQDKIKLLWLLGVDDFPAGDLAECFVVYQGHHGDQGAQKADVILPGAAYTEKHGTYVNLEGRIQRTRQATFPPGEAKEDWKILRAFSAAIGHVLPYDHLHQLRQHMERYNPVFSTIDQVLPARWQEEWGNLSPQYRGADQKPGQDTPGLDKAAFVNPIKNYYIQDVISRVSPTMAACSREILGKDSDQETGRKTGTDA